jgi:hypothetical protein
VHRVRPKEDLCQKDRRKGLLVNAACVAALGDIAPSPETNDDAELRKFLLAALIDATPIVLFDNLTHEISSAVLASVLTSVRWLARLLGRSKNARPMVLTTWVVTGNALRVSKEISRRTIWIRVKCQRAAGVEANRVQTQGPVGLARQHRADLIRACIILVNNWIAQGRPEGTETLGSFENWARVIGGILAAADIPGFLAESQEEDAGGAANEDDRRWHPLIQRWWADYGNQGVLPKDLIDPAPELVPEDEKLTNRSRVTRFGQLLGRAIGQVFEVEGEPNYYLKLGRAKVERTEGGAHDGYMLSHFPKNDIKVGKVGRTATNDQKGADCKENSSANLIGGTPAPSKEVGGAEPRESAGKSQLPPTSPTSTGKFNFERF